MINILEIPVDEMVEYLNEERMKNGLSVKDICKTHEVSYAVIQKRYNREYIYNKTTKRLEKRDNPKYEIGVRVLSEELEELREIINELREVPKKAAAVNAEGIINLCENMSQQDIKVVMEFLNNRYGKKEKPLDMNKLKGRLSGTGEFYSTKLDTDIKGRWLKFTSAQLANVQELTALAFHELMEKNGY